MDAGEMGDEEVLLSTREADRVLVTGEVVERRLRQAEAARRLGVSVRQVKRLACRYRERGSAGLVSGHRGRRPNNSIGAAVRREVLDLVRERYADFGPTFAREKLAEVHGHRLSAETLRCVLSCRICGLSGPSNELGSLRWAAHIVGLA